MEKKVIVLSSLVVVTILLLSCQKKVTTNMDDFVKQNQADIQHSMEALINPSEKGLTYTIDFSNATYHQPQLKYPKPYLSVPVTIQNDPKYIVDFKLFMEGEPQQNQMFHAVYDELETKNVQRIRYGFPDGQIYFLFGNQEQIFRKAIKTLDGSLNQQISKGELITPELMLKETFDAQKWSSNLNTVQLDYPQWFQDYAEGTFNVMDEASAIKLLTTYKLKKPVTLELSTNRKERYLESELTSSVAQELRSFLIKFNYPDSFVYSFTITYDNVEEQGQPMIAYDMIKLTLDDGEAIELYRNQYPANNNQR